MTAYPICVRKLPVMRVAYYWTCIGSLIQNNVASEYNSLACYIKPIKHWQHFK